MIARAPLPIQAEIPEDYVAPQEAIDLVAALLLDLVESGEGEPEETVDGGRRGGGS